MLEMAMRRKGRNETSMLDTVGKATETESGYAAHNKRGVEAPDQRELCWRKNKNKICINISISARVPFQATASFKHELQNNNNKKPSAGCIDVVRWRQAPSEPGGKALQLLLSASLWTTKKFLWKRARLANLFSAATTVWSVWSCASDAFAKDARVPFGLWEFR